MKTDPKLGKGIIAQIQESEVYSNKKFTKETLRNLLKDIQKSYEENQQKLLKLENDWSKHWKKKRKQYPREELPMWLVAKTHPRLNQGTGGVFLTSRETIEKNKKWLE